MKKTLPVEINAKLKIECWTYYKMAVIQTLPDYMRWLSSHMKVVGGVFGKAVYFGEQKPHPPGYFSDILTIEEIDLFSVSPGSIAKRIIREIDDGWYYVVFLRDGDNDSHEAFIYGYDDTEEVFYTISFNNELQFYANTISFAQLENGYRTDYEYYINNPQDYYSKFDFGYVMSRIKPTDKYIRKNYAIEYFDKLSYERYATRLDLNYIDQYDVFYSTKTYYTGILCLAYVRNKIQKMIDSDDERTDEKLVILRKNIYKLYEHRSLIYDSMKWYENVWQVSDAELLSMAEQYGEACKSMNLICKMLLKYLYTGNIRILKALPEKLTEQCDMEASVLSKYVEGIRGWYMHHVLPKLLENNYN